MGLTGYYVSAAGDGVGNNTALCTHFPREVGGHRPVSLRTFFGGGGVIVIAYTVYSSELEYLLNWTLFQNKDSIVNQRWRYQKSQVICERFTVYCLFFICSFFFFCGHLKELKPSILQNQQLMLNLDSPQVMKEPI